MRTLAILLPLLLASCVGMTDYSATVTAAGDKSERMRVYGLLGGSEAWETAGGTRWTGNRNKNFGQGAQAAVSLGGLAVGAANAKVDARADAYAKQVDAASNAKPTLVPPAQMAPETTVFPMVVPASKIPKPNF